MDQIGCCFAHRHSGLSIQYGGNIIPHFHRNFDLASSFGRRDTRIGDIECWRIQVACLIRKATRKIRYVTVQTEGTVFWGGRKVVPHNEQVHLFFRIACSRGLIPVVHIYSFLSSVHQGECSKS